MQKTTVTKDDFKWTLPVSHTTIGPTCYVTSENGIFILIQMVFSSLNSWSPSVQLTARIYGPNGLKKVALISESGANLNLSKDKLSSECGPMAFKFLDDGLGYKVSYNTHDFKIDFTVKAIGGGFQTEDGHHYFIDQKPSKGWVKSKFIPRGFTSGTCCIDGVDHNIKGHSVVTFVTMMHPQNVGRFNFCSFQNESASLMLYQLQLPEGSAKKQVSQAAFVLGGEFEAITLDNQIIFHEPELDEWCNHRIPTKITHEWKGHSKTGEIIEIVMKLNLSDLCDKIDVLAELPYLIRVFIQSFVTAPYVYQWYLKLTRMESACVTVTKDGQITEFRGKAFHETTFMQSIED